MNIFETDPTAINEMGFINLLFNMVKLIGIGYERYRASSQNASHAPKQKKFSEETEANLTCNGHGHP